MVLDPRRTARTVAATALAAASVVAPTATAVAAATGVTPAIGAHPEYRVVGSARTDARTFSCQTTTPAGCYGPAQVRTAYGVDALAARGLSGAGQTIVIVDAFQSPTIQHDLDTFDAAFGLPSAPLNIIAPDGLTPFDQNDDNQVGWAGEITLDVEYAHAIAPGATIDLVLAKSNQDADILSATRYAVDHNLGSVISQSFGEAEQCVDPALLTAEHQVFAAATAKGITLLASAGDQGAAQPSCDGSTFFKAASSPASDPLVTGVGGTRLDADGITGAYHGESTWNEPDFASAGGGGFSVVYKEPGYQRPVQKTGVRAVPDVAYNAAIIGGVLAVWSSSGQGSDLVFRFGGTSAGSPQWAGLVALTDQLKGGRVGEINDTLYHLSFAKKSYAADFHDVTTGDNTYHGDVTVTGFAATVGWDPATGLGTPKADSLVPALAQKS
ncbi:MAG: S53 family peptidase [Jatrophihabitans sp.]|uniref:S53 family peptidase n=1 Tax=Jatrophihabitans sp. TaxID=1932789 RepID=UPI003F812B2D